MTNEPIADLRSLDRLVGTWRLSEETSGTVRFEWLEERTSCSSTSNLGPPRRRSPRPSATPPWSPRRRAWPSPCPGRPFRGLRDLPDRPDEPVARGGQGVLERRVA